MISPPFLPSRGVNESDEAFIARAMPVAAHGAYPVSQTLAWHGGIHLTAPRQDNRTLPVRAIADGVVVYRRPPTAIPSDTAAVDANALGYNGWTDDGVVVIRHDTEIGADAQGTGIQVRFFSIYMHLNSVRVQADQAIHRKADIGRAGMFEGEANMLHFEIICDDENLRHLIGRTSGDVSTRADGRSEAVFGEMYFSLPASAPVHAERPPLHEAAATGGAPLGEALFVGIRHAGGDARITTYRATGMTLGAALVEAEAEYNLYRDSAAIVRSYRTAQSAAVPAHSAVYELLRFGRTLGPDALNPGNTPHWREIRTPAGQGWVNLNAPDIHKYSDADAPHWTGWHLMQDYQDGDSRCDAAPIGRVLDANGDGINTRTEAEARLRNPAIRNFLKRLICKFPTEWHRGNVATRWNWLTRESPSGQSGSRASPYLTQTDFPEFQKYAEALCFWEDADLGIPEAHWHFDPREFVVHFKKCCWLSRGELAQVYPDALYRRRETPDPDARREEFRYEVNIVARKYSLQTPTRLTHFFGQGAVESFNLARMIEASTTNFTASLQPETNGFYVNPNDLYFDYLDNRLGNVDPDDGIKFRGRGMKQLTGRENYSKYWVYRAWLSPATFDVGWYRNRRTLRPAVIDDPQRLSTNNYNCIDAGGWYWEAGAASAGFRSINRSIAENDISPAAIRNVTRAINGGLNGIPDRITHTQRIASIFNDLP